MKKYIFILLCLFTLQSFAKENYGLNSLVNNQLSIESEDIENQKNIAFGEDDLEIPAFLRNSN